MLQTSAGMVVCVSKNSRSSFLSTRFSVRYVAKRYILQRVFSDK